MVYVDPNLDENIQNIRNRHVRDRHQTAVTIVHDEVTAQFTRREVVDAASAVSDVTENKTFYWD